MKRKKIELEWFVYVNGLNCNGFRKENVFNNIKFEEYTIKHLKDVRQKRSLQKEFRVNYSIILVQNASMS